MSAAVTRIRVDLPSLHSEDKGSFAYFYISATDGQQWHPWWNSLFEFLLRLERWPAGVHPRGAEMEVARMSGRTRQDFISLLRSAPASEVERHRTLRTALRRLPQSEDEVPVRYFNPGPQTEEKA